MKLKICRLKPESYSCFGLEATGTFARPKPVMILFNAPLVRSTATHVKIVGTNKTRRVKSVTEKLCDDWKNTWTAGTKEIITNTIPKEKAKRRRPMIIPVGRKYPTTAHAMPAPNTQVRYQGNCIATPNSCRFPSMIFLGDVL